MIPASKLAIGTAQFGFSYGIANPHGQVDAMSAAAILGLAARHGIRTLDTAMAYGNSEETLGNIGVSDWQVVSKLPEIPPNVVHVGAWVEAQIRHSIKRLRVDSLYALLLHRPQQLLEPRGAEIYAAMQHARRAGLVQKIGISIYEPSELDVILGSIQMDMVQAPLNLWDRRMVDSGWAARLKEMGIEFHARSVFLQGLLLMPQANRPKKFKRWQAVWQAWDGWLQETGLTPIAACLRYVLAMKEVDKVIIGVDSVAQLQEILNAAEETSGTVSAPQWSSPMDSDLINPARWETQEPV